MTIDSPGRPPKTLSPGLALLLTALAAGGYWLAFSNPSTAAAVLLALPCLFLLARLRTARMAFYGGMAAGIAIYLPHLLFFRSVFGPAAFPLWLVAGLPVGVFLLLLHLAHRHFGPMRALWLTPVLWTGVEYFRSEIWYLRFAWLLPGQAAAFLPGVRMMWLGVYGLGFLYALAAAMLIGPRVALRLIGAAALLVMGVLMYVPQLPATSGQAPLHVAGMQLEFPDERRAPRAIDEMAIAHPEAQVLVLSEYTFLGEVPPAVREAVKKHRRYFIAGGVLTRSDGTYYNTAFVIGPDGQDVFSQAKSVPVQFMSDGLPAPQRRVWDSPWGKIGIAVCYDLSYARVMDDFVRQGAGGLIIPTMDLKKWGEYERRTLHGRMAPIRSAEYGIPTFGVWSSGVSQLTDRYGRVIATGEYPGQGDMIAGPFDLRNPGRVPPDRLPALGASVATGLFVFYLAGCSIIHRRKKKGT